MTLCVKNITTETISVKCEPVGPGQTIEVNCDKKDTEISNLLREKFIEVVS